MIDRSNVPAKVSTDKPAALLGKLSRIVIPSLEFSGTPLADALDYFRVRAEQLDTDAPAGSRGVNIVVLNQEALPEAAVTLNLNNVPLGDALRYSTELAGYVCVIEDGVVVVKKPAPKKSSSAAGKQG